MLTSTLLFPDLLYIFYTNTVHHLRIAFSGSPRELAVTELIKQVVQKCKLMLSKTLQILLEGLCDGVPFSKIVSPDNTTAQKRRPSLNFSSEYLYSLFLFTQLSIDRCSANKRFLTISQTLQELLFLYKSTCI